MWKDKFNTPHHERGPTFKFSWMGFGLSCEGGEEYWERRLWIDYYCGGDKSIAESTWPWRNENGENTWNLKEPPIKTNKSK